MSTQKHPPDLPRFLQKRRVRRNVTRILVTLTDLAFRNLSASAIRFEVSTANDLSDRKLRGQSAQTFYSIYFPT
jgi:hypothetical protein